MLTAAELVGLALLVCAHLIGGRLPALFGPHLHRWLSVFAGVAVAYVFIQVLPELGRAQQEFQAHADGWLATFEQHVYLISLCGLLFFYGVESGLRRHRAGLPDDAPSGNAALWLHIGTFGIYNAVVGYLLVRGEQGELTELAFYSIALFLHFLVVDFGLAKDHRSAYRREVRWLLSAAIAVGCGLGFLVEVSELAVAALTAFLAGGVLLNVLKEELPEEGESDFGLFLLGTVAYGTLLLMA